MPFLSKKSTRGEIDIGKSLERNKLEVVSGIVNQEARENKVFKKGRVK
jgi:hypothetical protein